MKQFIYILNRCIRILYKMRVTEAGLQIVKDAEGLRLRTYLCPAGILTIGYGHTRGVTQDMEITEEQANEFLKDDVIVAENYINKYNLRLKQCQFDALVSFVFNVGSGNFANSTMLKLIKKDPDDPAIADEFLKWKYSGGKVFPGLVTRRKKEKNLYFSC